MANEPWRHSTGPTTPEGKRKAAVNGKSRQVGPQSARALRAEMAEFVALVGRMRAGRAGILPASGGASQVGRPDEFETRDGRDEDGC